MKPLLALGAPGSPARAQRALSDFTEGLGFVFSRETWEEKDSTVRLWDVSMTLARAHSVATVSHLTDRLSQLWVGFYNIWPNLNSVAGVVSCLLPFLLQSGSVKASVGPESRGWFYAFLPSLVQVLKKGSRPWVGNVLLVPDVPQTLFVILDKWLCPPACRFLICKMGVGLVQKSNFSVPNLPEALKGSPCLWFQKAW